MYSKRWVSFDESCKSEIGIRYGTQFGLSVRLLKNGNKNRLLPVKKYYHSDLRYSMFASRDNYSETPTVDT